MVNNRVVIPEKRIRREANNLAMAFRGIKRNQVPIYTAEEIIKQAVKKHGNKLVLGFSGGHCSVTLLHMALKVKPDIKVVFNNTGVEFPENVKYVHLIEDLWNLNLIVTRPKDNFWVIAAEHGMPLPRSMGFGKKKRYTVPRNRFASDKRPWCCHLLKEVARYGYYIREGITGDMGGLRASESRLRAMHTGKYGQIYHVKKLKIRPAMWVYNPIALWTIIDVENYLINHDIPRNLVYETQTRNGCWTCTCYKGWEENIFRWNPRAYKILAKKYNKSRPPSVPPAKIIEVSKDDMKSHDCPML